jgi:hypothetical protein
MEDVYLPGSKSRGLSSRSSTLRPNRDDKPANVLPSRAENVWAENKNVLTQQPASSTTIERSQASSFENRAQLALVQRPPTVLALRDGIRYLVADYWVEKGNLNLAYVIVGGGPPENVPLSALDIAMTERINAQRGVPFLLTVRGR